MKKIIEHIENLERGNIVQHKVTGDSFVIVAKLEENRALGMRSTTITNPNEWLLITKE